MEETARQPNKKRKRRVTKRFIVTLAALALCAAIAVILLKQEQKIRELTLEQAKLTEEYKALQTEEERLEYMIEYAKSREYLLQYAREVLGMVLPGDTIYDGG